MPTHSPDYERLLSPYGFHVEKPNGGGKLDEVRAHVSGMMKQFRLERESRGLPLEAVATRLEISPDDLRRYESGNISQDRFDVLIIPWIELLTIDEQCVDGIGIRDQQRQLHQSMRRLGKDRL